MIINLILIFIVVSNKEEKIKNKILKISFLSLIFVIIIWIKEYFLPTLDYEVWLNYAVSTFWNKQFLAFYLLLFLPLIIKNYALQITKIKPFYILFLILYFGLLFITKSLIPIILSLSFLVFYIFWKRKWYIILSLLFLIWGTLIFLYFPEKINSFLSRFFIWFNTFQIWFSDLKSLVIWNWFETLNLIFDREKNPYLYIFENFGFSADRNHNLFLDIFFSTWIIWLIIAFYTTYKIIYISKDTIYFQVFILALFFLFFNFASIVHYTILILFLTLLIKEKTKFKYIDFNVNKFLLVSVIFLNFFIFFSFSKFLISEINYKKWDLDNAIKYFSYPEYYIENQNHEEWLSYYRIIPEIYFKNIILNEPDNIIQNCENLTKNYKTAENFLWCWKILEIENYKNESLIFYKNWILFLPNLWKNDSMYINNFFIKITKDDIKHRFFNEKYSNIKEVLEKLEKNNIYVK